MKELSRQNLVDMLTGCVIMGTGGGGELSLGLQYIDQALAAGKRFRLLDLDDVPDECLICTPYLLGELIADTGLAGSNEGAQGEPPIMKAVKRMQDYVGKPFYGAVACELGGENTAIPAFVAAMTDGFLIDADAAGRAVPEITHSTYYLNGLDASPIVLANQAGECFVCENIPDDQRAEEIVRSLAQASNNDVSVVDHALPAGQLRHALIKGTVSQALRLGQRFREAKQAGADIADAVARCGGGYVGFSGRVSHFNLESESGFSVGALELAGEGKWSGQHYRIEIKNENMASWLDGELHVTIPELICLINLDEQSVLTNINHAEGMAIAVIILPAPAPFTTRSGLDIFGPAYLGLESPYRPTVADAD